MKIVDSIKGKIVNLGEKFKDISLDVTVPDKNPYILEKTKESLFSFSDVFKFFIRHLLIFLFSLCASLGVAYACSDTLAPQTYYATSYLSTTEIIHSVVYQSVTDLLLSNKIIDDTVSKIKETKPYDGADSLSRKYIQRNLQVVSNDQHFQISIKYTSSKENSILYVLSSLIDSFYDEINSDTKLYEKIYNYIKIQEEATYCEKNASTKPFVYLSSYFVFLVFAVIISLLLDKKYKYYLTATSFSSFSDLCVLPKKAKISDEQFLLLIKNFTNINKNQKETTIVFIVPTQFKNKTMEGKINNLKKIFAGTSFKTIQECKASSFLLDNSIYYLICERTTYRKSELKNITTFFRPKGIILSI